MASLLLSQHLAKVIRIPFSMLKGDHVLEQQIKITNDIIRLLKKELDKNEFDDDLIETEGRILKAIYNELNANFSDFETHLKEITNYTRLTHS